MDINNRRIIVGLVIVKAFSTCFEIEAYYPMAGAPGWGQLGMLHSLSNKK